MNQVFWISDGKLGGRPGPHRSPWSVEELSSTIDVVVNISEHPSPEREFAVLGIKHIWIPLPTTVPPDAQAERMCMECLPRAESYLSEQLREGCRVLVHCVSGKDRTGMLLAYHLARRDGLKADKALSEVRKVRPAALNAEGWEAMALRVISHLLDAA